MQKRIPTVDTTSTTVTNGLTLTHVVAKAYTFTIAQVKYLCTADKIIGYPVTREQGQDLIKSLARENRYELFGSFAPYTITFNGYGQLKSMCLKDGGRVRRVEEIFNILGGIYVQ